MHESMNTSRTPWLAAAVLFFLAACANCLSEGLLGVLTYQLAQLMTAVFAVAGVITLFFASGRHTAKPALPRGALIALGLAAAIGSVVVLLESGTAAPKFGAVPGFFMLIALPALIIAASICFATAFPVTAADGSASAAEDASRRTAASTWPLSGGLYVVALAVVFGGVFLEGLANSNVVYPLSQVFTLLLVTVVLTLVVRASEFNGLSQGSKTPALFALLALPTLMSIFAQAVTGRADLYDFTYLDVILMFIGAFGLAVSAGAAFSFGAWRSKKA